MLTLLSSLLFGQQRAYMIGEQTAIFYPENYHKNLQEPSFALIKEPKRTAPLDKDWKLNVKFDSIQSKNIAVINIDEDVDLYGTGEVTGQLRRDGTTRTLWNTDNFAYSKFHGLHLYQSHPWVLGVRQDGSAFGVLADNTYKQKIILDEAITFKSDGPSFRMIIIDGKNPDDVLMKLGEWTGKMPLPPLWALGYQQCRWSYYPDKRVKEIADTMRLKKIPCDVIWMDIHYMDEYRVFTFSEDNFPDPIRLNKYLNKKNFKSVWMIDPGVKYDENYEIYKSGSEKNVWVKDSAGNNYLGNVWPGPCVFPDFTQAKTRDWWSALYKDYMSNGIDGVWNDMNEPAVFDTPGFTMPDNNLHYGDDSIPEGKHSRYHNVYGMLMVKASREGILNANPDKRPFILTRSNFIGGQRYAATWTGDNESTWKHLKQSIPMVLNLGLSGQPFSGPDIGGFGGNATPELYANWIAIGAFYPFSRSHTAEGTNNQEPWSFGQEIEDVSRKAIERRYRLLPYLYTLFYEASKTGLSIMRPLFMVEPTNLSLREEDEAFMLGKDLMIIPKWAGQPQMPSGNWRAITLVTDDNTKNKYQPDLKIRPGAIIPLGENIQSTVDYSLNKITLLVSLDEKGKAKGKLYADAGDGYGYKKGEYVIITFEAKKTEDSIEIICLQKEGKFDVKNRQIEVKIIDNDKIIEGKGSIKRAFKIPYQNLSDK